MTSPLVFSTPSALEYFAVLVAEDRGLALLEAAISVAQDEYPDLDPQSVLCEIDALAARLKQRLAVDAPPLQRLRLLNHFFFRELGLRWQRQQLLRPAQQLHQRCVATAARATHHIGLGLH